MVVAILAIPVAFEHRCAQAYQRYKYLDMAMELTLIPLFWLENEPFELIEFGQRKQKSRRLTDIVYLSHFTVYSMEQRGK